MRFAFRSMLLLLVSALACSGQVLYEYDAAAGGATNAVSIQSPVVQGWAESGLGSGVSVGGVYDGTNFAWNISDDSSSLIPHYEKTLSANDLIQMFSSGWEFEFTVKAVRSEVYSGFCAWGVSTGSDPGWNLTERERVGFAVNYIPASNAFQIVPTHGGTVTLAAGAADAFHTIRCVGAEGASTYEFFVDGISQGMFDIKDGSSNNHYDEKLRVGSGSTDGIGHEAEWSRIRLSVNEPLMIVLATNGETLIDEEGATSDSFTVELAQQPSNTVTVTVAPPSGSTDIDFGAGPGVPIGLVFTTNNWNSAQTVSVTAVDDAAEDGDKDILVTLLAASTDTVFDGAQKAALVTILDNDLVVQEINFSSQPFISPKGAFVTSSNAYHTFRIPGMVIAADGSVLAFADGRRGYGQDPRIEDNAPMDAVMRRSTDHGKTWDDLTVIDSGFKSTGAKVDFADPTPVLDETTGDVFLFYGQWPDSGPITANWGQDPDSADGNHVVWVQSSSDHGVTWSGPTQILYPDEPNETPDGLYWRNAEPGPGNGIQLQHQNSPSLNGRLVIPAKRSGSSTPTGSAGSRPFVYYSDDHGATWQVGDVTDGPAANEDEVVELNDGTLLLDARQNSGSYRRRHKSTDGGINWGPNLGDDIAITRVDCSMARYSSVREGQDRNRILFSGPLGPGRANAAVWVSYDEGQSFINPVQLNNESSAYSVVARMADGSIGAFFETEHLGAGYGDITLYNFNIDFLEGMIHPRKLTHHDGFGNPIDRSRGGTGWSGSWSAGATFTDVAEDEFGSASIMVADFDRGRSFGRMDLVGAQSTERSLSRPINLGTDGRTYVSLLVSRQLDESANGMVDEELRVELRDFGGAAQASFGIDSTEAFFIDGLGARQTSHTGGFSLTEPYLLVLKIASSATGDDQLFFKVYANNTFCSGSVESDVSWTLVGDTGASSSAILEQIALVGSADAHWSVDEIRIGETWSSVAGEDTDEDGLDDAWEIKHFFTLAATDGSGDADQDTMSDADEEEAGTDPHDPASRFAAAIQGDGDGLQLSWSSVDGRFYGIASSTNLPEGSWQPEQSGIFAAPPTNTILLSPTGDQAFYRIILE